VEIGELYQLVLLLVLVGMILGVGVLTLDKFADAATYPVGSAYENVTKNAAIAVNNTRAAITPIASTWLPLVVTVAILAIILTLVIRSFAMRGR
jgi:hypothetical protein